MTNQAVGTYQIENGATVIINSDTAADYSLMRASQLSAILNVMALQGFSEASEETRSDCLWLANTLSAEIKSLIPILSSVKMEIAGAGSDLTRAKGEVE